MPVFKWVAGPWTTFDRQPILDLPGRDLPLVVFRLLALFGVDVPSFIKQRPVAGEDFQVRHPNQHFRRSLSKRLLHQVYNMRANDVTVVV